MIVSCEKCHTRFKLDGKRLRSAGVKLRCSKCQHTFELKPPPPAADAPGATVAPAPGDTPESGTHPPGSEEAVLGAPPGTGGTLHPDEIERAVDAALRIPEEPAAPDMNEAEGGGRSARAEDLFGAPGDIGADGPPSDPPRADAMAPSDPRERSEDFDWDHLSFTESRPASVDEALKTTEESERSPGNDTLELDVDRPKLQKGRDASPKNRRETRREPGPAEPELELARPVPSQDPPEGRPRRPVERRGSSGSGLQLESRPSPRPASQLSSPLPGAAEPAARSARSVAGVTLPSFSLPSPVAARPMRPPLVLPRVPTLAGSIAVGLLVALVSAFTLYAPRGPITRTSAILRPAGSASGGAALRIEELSVLRIDGVDTTPRYAVTGRASWSAPPGGSWVLDGVLVDRDGHALQRRGARIGSPAALSNALDADPASPAAIEPLPAKGESRFLVLFDPRPAWQPEVRFEVRRAR